MPGSPSAVSSGAGLDLPAIVVHLGEAGSFLGVGKREETQGGGISPGHPRPQALVYKCPAWGCKGLLPPTPSPPRQRLSAEPAVSPLCGS